MPLLSASRTVALLSLFSGGVCVGLQPHSWLALPTTPTTALRAATTMQLAASPPAPPARASANLVLATVVACQGALQFGFAIGVLNIPQQLITTQLAVSPDGIAWAAVVSIWALGGLLGTPPHTTAQQPTAHHSTPQHTTAHHITSHHTTSQHTPPHPTSPHLTPPHPTSPHPTSPHLTP